MSEQGFDWLEVKVRPKKDGLHDSGYRFIQLTGVRMSEDRDGSVEKVHLHQWSDHVLLHGITNIDVQPDGTVRLMCWTQGKWETDGFFGSSAMFYASDLERVADYLRSTAEIRDMVRGTIDG